jgi:hypothetical protein
VKRRAKTAIEFFERDVIRQEGCWGWRGSVAKKKDPRPIIWLWIEGRTASALATHVSFRLAHGRVPAKQINHTCHNSLCTNPEHLYEGTQQQNMRDKVEADRQIRGTDSWNATLNDEVVLAMRQMFLIGVPVARVAIAFGTHPATTRDAIRGVTWKHVLPLLAG